MPGRNLHGGSGIVQTDAAEMQKAADAADISVLFFQLVLIFGPFWVIFGPFFGANFFLPKIYLCYFITFCISEPDQNPNNLNGIKMIRP